MQIQVIRTKLSPKSTLGALYVDGTFYCYTLEDVVRPVGEGKVYGKTAIPTGRYEVQLTMSNRFKRVLPLLVDVPGFAGIRIHPGNTAEDTEGCLLVGTTLKEDFVGNSRVAFDRLFDVMQSAKNGITIRIENQF